MITVHAHARKRAIERFAVMPQEANRWVNERFKECTFLEFQPDGRKRYIHPEEPIFIVTTSNDDTIISIIDKEKEFVSVKSTFLDSMMPTLEREYENMKRSFRVQYRELEKRIAEAITNKGITLQKRARVYHPPTQKMLELQAQDYDALIAKLEADAAKLKSEYELASIKVRAFLRTASGLPR